MNAHVRIFQALADPVRLDIVDTMKTKERAVNDIVARVKIHQSGVSRHLHILAEAGLVQMRPDGQKRFYSLRKEAFEQIDTWMAGYRRHWVKRLDRLGDALERRQSLRSRYEEKA